MSIDRVVLTGFMGSGKSTVGPLLAKALAWTFVDIDQELESQAGLPASLLFRRLGEAAFRDYELSVTADCLQATKIVIALGGAAVDLEPARKILSASVGCWIVFLDGPFDLLVARCLLQESLGSATYRPLLRRPEIAFARYATRREWNQQIAHQIVDVSASSAEKIAASIIDRLRPELQTSQT